MDSGWIRLHRRIRDNPLWPKRRRYTPLEAWLDLLLDANHAHNEVLLGTTKMITIERGQVLTSQVGLSKRWKWHRETTIAFLEQLKALQMLDIQTSKQTSTGYTLLTIQNYRRYQDIIKDESDIHRTSKPQNPDIETDILPPGITTENINGNPNRDIQQPASEPASEPASNLQKSSTNKNVRKKKNMSGKPDLVSPSSNQEIQPQSPPTKGKENKPRRSRPDHGPVISETINRLNQLAGTSYRPTTKATAAHIRARLAEGFTVDDLILVVKHRWSDWGDDPKMQKFFRPETLFGPKFEGYLQDAKRNGSGTKPMSDEEEREWRRRTFVNAK